MSGEVAQHSAGLDAVVAPGKYLTRQQTLLRLFFATYWLVVFTGAIRKWLFPTNQIFYLLQDIPLAIAYLYALWTGLFTRFFLALGVASLCAVLIAHGLLQVVLIDLPIKVLVIGLHNYIFYLPMLLIFPLAMTAEGRKKIHPLESAAESPHDTAGCSSVAILGNGIHQSHYCAEGIWRPGGRSGAWNWHF